MDNEKQLKKNLDNRTLLGKLFKKYPGIWFLSLFLIPIGVTIFAYSQLSYIGYVPQKLEEPPFIPVQLSISTVADTSTPIPLWLIISVFFCCASGSLVIFYLLKNSMESQKAYQRTRNSQKFNSHNRNKSINSPSERENLLIILPPEKIYPLNNNTAVVRDFLNISQHRY